MLGGRIIATLNIKIHTSAKLWQLGVRTRFLYYLSNYFSGGAKVISITLILRPFQARVVLGPILFEK